jgi:NAD+ synthase
MQPLLSPDALKLDAAAECARIERSIRGAVFGEFRRKGAVVGVSGGIDSSVVASLSARALGSDRVIALFTPEADSSPESFELGRLLAEQLNVRWFLEDIGPILLAARCYERRDDAIRKLVPEYGPDWLMKIVLPPVTESAKYALFSLVVQSPAGETRKVRLSMDAYLGVVASTNFKQRTRKMMEYYYADRYNYCVAGTPNRLEYDQGFFVKNGDGSADFKPIAHLYKSQVYQIAEYLDVPEPIRRRPPTTDTYSLAQTQEEFYFSLPLDKMDLCLYAYDHQFAAGELAAVVGLTPEQAARVYESIESKRKVAHYLHAAPVLVEPVGKL